AKRFREVFFSTFQGIKAWHERIKKELKAKGEIKLKTLGGKPMIAYTFTDAANYPIQGTGAELLKLSVLIFSQEIKRHFPSMFHEVANVVNLVHDEIVVEAKEDYKEEVSKLLENSMRKAGSILLNNVKVETEIVINKRWIK
ncbi:MAG TPA: bifunctional 3'-5' exonuclease/DNA polymerase, partial [Hydrogenobaculum sp.]|nr:bifunctional 3'-5' exonuclease/DNA polymerase [Hydrogenobaculum sp.]